MSGFLFAVAETQDKSRGTSTERGYNIRWRKARETYLRAHPLCAMHLKIGRYVVATVVDHIVPHRGDSTLFWDTANWQALCKRCHDAHKQRQEKSGRIVGCDQSGQPTDPSHPWNTEGRGGEKSTP